MNIMETMGKKLLSQLIYIEQIGWPPSCAGFLYQPERPVSDRFKREESSIKDKSK